MPAFVGIADTFVLCRHDRAATVRSEWQVGGVINNEPEEARPPPLPEYAHERRPGSSVVPVTALGGTPVWIFDGRRYRQIGVRPDTPRDD